jgi:hypothetical protein
VSGLRQRMNRTIEELALEVVKPSETIITPYDEFISILEWQGRDHGLKLLATKRQSFEDRQAFRESRMYQYGDDARTLFTHDCFMDYVRFLNLYVNPSARNRRLGTEIMKLVFRCSDLSKAPVYLYARGYEYLPGDNPDFFLDHTEDFYKYDNSDEGKRTLEEHYMRVEPTLERVRWPIDGKIILKYTPKAKRDKRL